MITIYFLPLGIEPGGENVSHRHILAYGDQANINPVAIVNVS